MQSKIVGNDCFFYLLGNVPRTIAFLYFLFSLKLTKFFVFYFHYIATEYTILKRNRQVKRIGNRYSLVDTYCKMLKGVDQSYKQGGFNEEVSNLE